jgi:hypothetical protein
MKARSKFRVEVKQSIYDLAIQEYGTIESVFELLKDNADKIPGLDTNLVPGTLLKAISEPGDADMLRYYKDRRLQPVSLDENVAGMHGDYNDGFNDDYWIN